MSGQISKPLSNPPSSVERGSRVNGGRGGGCELNAISSDDPNVEDVRRRRGKDVCFSPRTREPVCSHAGRERYDAPLVEGNRS